MNQRSERAEGAGIDAYRNGAKLLPQGRVDEAVLAFRNGLAHTPRNYILRTALSKEWRAGEEPPRRAAQFDYATLLSDSGRRSEAISLLLTMIEQRGDDPAVGKRAGDTVKAIGSREQTEEAYSMPASRFPAASAWVMHGDARSQAGEERLAPDAYQRAAKAVPHGMPWLAPKTYSAWIRHGGRGRGRPPRLR